MKVILPKQVGKEDGKVLFLKSEPVKDLKEAEEIVKILKETMKYYGGVGLAAPQVGILKRVFVINIESNERYSQKIPNIGFKAYINPKILECSLETNIDLEGCLSVFYATLYGKVERPNYLKIKYLDLEGKEKTEKTIHPFQTRVILHENDHLDGIIFLQRMKKEDFSDLIWEEKFDIRKRTKNSPPS